MNMNSMSSWFNNVSDNIGSQFSRLSEVVGVLPDSDEDSAYDKVKKEDAGDDAAGDKKIVSDSTDDKKENNDAGVEKDGKATMPDSSSVQDNLKNFGGMIYRFADKASKQMTEAAQQAKQKLEDNSILGDFQREQERFIAEKQGPGASTSALPPWAGCVDETALKKQILSLSLDSRNFLRDPPTGTQFQFDYSVTQPVAEATLKEDPNLMKMRFALVPKEVCEEIFWRNYFYRVSLITQSMQLKNFSSSEAKTPSPTVPMSKTQKDQQQDASGDAGGKKATDKDKPTGSGRSAGGSTSTPPGSPSARSPPAHEEFLSDTVQTELNESELQQVREALGLGGSDATPDGSPASPESGTGSKTTSAIDDDWERELVAELTDFELVKDGNTSGNNKQEEEWEKEISDLLEADVAEDEVAPSAPPAASDDAAKK